MCDLLRVDGLIVHVNPLQEAMQPEGDVFTEAPIATIKATLAALPGLPIIVKEVGQGMGPQSLAQLLRLPLLAIDTAANGGTNFSKLELLRSDDARQEAYESIVNIGHGANEMVGWVNELLAKEHAQAMEQTREGTDLARTRVQCKHLIISGGLRTFLDGYYLTEKSNLPAIYGQASAFLKYARSDYATLQRYVTEQVRGLELAKAYLRPRT
jgi:isopentenyl-diphosphate delta-isomerase